MSSTSGLPLYASRLIISKGMACQLVFEITEVADLAASSKIELKLAMCSVSLRLILPSIIANWDAV